MIMYSSGELRHHLEEFHLPWAFQNHGSWGDKYRLKLQGGKKRHNIFFLGLHKDENYSFWYPWLMKLHINFKKKEKEEF